MDVELAGLNAQGSTTCFNMILLRNFQHLPGVILPVSFLTRIQEKASGGDEF